MQVPADTFLRAKLWLPISRQAMNSVRLGIVGSLVAVGGVLLFAAAPWAGPKCTQVRGSGTLAIPVDRLAREQVEFFCYHDAGGKDIRFLLARDSDGKIYSVFDACHQCYKYHEGFTFYHGKLICRLCGNRYRIKDIATGKASCKPLPLPSRLHGDEMLVKVSDLEAKRWLF